MAAATYTIHSLAVELARAMNDAPTSITGNTQNAGYRIMSLTEYTRFALQCRSGGIQTYTLNQIGTSGVWDYQIAQGADSPVALWLENNTTPFSGDNDCTYQVFCIGPSIFQSVGTTDTATSLTLTGFPVNFREALARVKEFIAGYRILQYTQSNGINNISPEQAAQALRDDARNTRGAFGA